MKVLSSLLLYLLLCSGFVYAGADKDLFSTFAFGDPPRERSEAHTSELQSRQ